MNSPRDSEWYIGGTQQIVLNSNNSSNDDNSLHLLRHYYVPDALLNNINIISFNHHNNPMIANIIITIL